MKKLLSNYLKIYDILEKEGIELTPKLTTMGIALSLTDKETGQSMFLLDQFKNQVKPSEPILYEFDTISSLHELETTLLSEAKAGNEISLRKILVSLNPVSQEIVSFMCDKYPEHRSARLFLNLAVEKELPSIVLTYSGPYDLFIDYVKAELTIRLEQWFKEKQQKTYSQMTKYNRKLSSPNEGTGVNE